MTLTYFNNASRCCSRLAIKLTWIPDMIQLQALRMIYRIAIQTLKSYQSCWDVPYVPTISHLCLSIASGNLSWHFLWCGLRVAAVALEIRKVLRSIRKSPPNKNPWRLWTCPTASLPVQKAIETMTRVSYPTTRQETDQNVGHTWQTCCVSRSIRIQMFLRFKP